MKILQVISSVSVSMGGPSQVAICLTKELRRKGIDAEIATTNDDGRSLLRVPLGCKTEHKGVPVFFFPRASWRMKSFIFSAPLKRWLEQNITSYDIVITHYLFSYPATIACRLANHHRIPYFMLTHGQLTKWALKQSALRKKLYLWLIERGNLSRARGVIATTAIEELDLRRLDLQTAAHVIPLAMDIKKIEPSAAQVMRFKYDFKESIPVILFCSRVHCTKRLELLIDALGDLLKKGNRFYFLVAGDGDPTYVLTMKKRVVKKDLGSVTHFTGSLSGRDLDIAYQGSDIFVLPSHSENFSLATAEAMASGLPVIITDAIPLSADVSRYEAGFVVKPNQSALMDAIVILLSNHELRRKMGKNGRCLVRECYNSDKIVQQHVRLYQSIEKPSPASEP